VTIPVGAAAPAGQSQNLTSGAFQNHYEIFFSSCKSSGETSYQARIYATTGFMIIYGVSVRYDPPVISRA
jgi:hypothetical protein